MAKKPDYSNRNLSREDYLWMCAQMWDYIAVMDCNQHDAHMALYPERDFPPSFCWACAYVSRLNLQTGSVCTKCPIDRWREDGREAACAELEYGQWETATSPKERKRLALRIAQLARESISDVYKRNPT